MFLGTMLIMAPPAEAGIATAHPQNDPLAGLTEKPTKPDGDAVTKNVNRDAMSGPGKTLGTFMQAMTDQPKNYKIAVDCLDLGDGITINDANRQRALDLYVALSALGYMQGTNKGIPAAADDKTEFQLFPAPDGVSTLVNERSKRLRTISRGQGLITLALDGKGIWRFDQKTVSARNNETLRLAVRRLALEDPELLATIRQSDSVQAWLLRIAPESLWNKFLFMSWIQWIGIGIVIFLGVLTDFLVRFTLGIVLSVPIKRIIRKISGCETFEYEHVRKSSRAIGFVLGILVWRWGLQTLFLPIVAYNVLLIITDVLLVLASINAAFKLTDLLGDIIGHRAKKSANKLDDLLIPILRKTMKFIILVFGMVYVAGALNIEVTPLVAGIGIGSLGFAFAAQNSIENFFGSLTVILDRPFQVGDWISMDGIDGTVETVGLRSTRIRTFYNSEMTIPNSLLIKTMVDNYGRRRFRRWSTKVDLLYETTPEQVEAFCEGARELVRHHPYMQRDNYQIFLNEFGESGIQILIYVFWNTPDWSTELRERHRYMLDLMRLAKELGVSFAYPTQTVYLARANQKFEEPDGLHAGQQEFANHESGRAAARRIMKGAGWNKERPKAYRYTLAEKSIDGVMGEDAGDSGDAGDGAGGGEGE